MLGEKRWSQGRSLGDATKKTDAKTLMVSKIQNNGGGLILDLRASLIRLSNWSSSYLINTTSVWLFGSLGGRKTNKKLLHYTVIVKIQNGVH